MQRFENKVAVVTGAANGIGANLVKRLVEEGARVALLDIEEETLKSLCGVYPENQTCCVHCDVRVKASVDDAVRRVVDHFGRIDILFNNAGIVRFAPFMDITEADWRAVIDTNLTGLFFVGQAVAREMIRLGIRGVIVNTSSSTQERVTARSAACGPSKGGVRQLTRIMSLELFPYGIRVNEVAPGATMTGINEKSRQDKAKYAKMVEKFVLKRFAYPEEITSVMLFLASDDASWVHGDSYMVDAGYCAW